jgi:hypothetical protein
MLQIDHVYEFFYQELFKEFDLVFPENGIIKTHGSITENDVNVFTSKEKTNKKIFFYDQEPLIRELANPYFNLINDDKPEIGEIRVLATSEYSQIFNEYLKENNWHKLYYFFHGFAALDWYRGYYALNYNKLIVKEYKYDFISFNRIITNDRSYRIYFVSLLNEHKLLNNGLVSFNVTDNLFDDWRDEVSDPNSKLSEQAKQHAEEHLVNIDKLVIDRAELPGSASADIPRNVSGWFYPGKEPPNVDALWHIVTETVFYYDKLHLTEKIFKPIVSKQPFMLLAAPGNLEYLRSYGFKTFEGIIDESYDNIQDHDARIESVVRQLTWYCNLSDKEKNDVIRAIEPIVMHNFHHFYNDFKHIITKEFLDNIKQLYREINFSDNNIDYESIYYLLTY